MRKSDFTLPTLDDLFSTQAERDDAKLERVRNIPLAELHPFKGHPFKVQNNEEMQRMIESIRKVGAITPALARPLPDGGYELISGHRRLAACQVLGVETMPVIVRELSDDEAVIAMVDANLQRETILPSEKAFAYKMKLDAIKHQGITSAQVGQKLLSVEKVADDAGESRRSNSKIYPPDLPDSRTAFDGGRRQDRLQPGGGAFLLRLVSAAGGAGRDGAERLHPVPRPEHPPEKAGAGGLTG